MTKFVLMVLLTLLCSVISGEKVQAAATLPKEPVAENPISIVIPRDLPLTLPEQNLENRGIRIVAIGDSGTGNPDQIKVARAMEKFCAERLQ